MAQEYPNVHKHLGDDQLHTPIYFSSASVDTEIKKDLLGEVSWDKVFWGAPVLGFVDAASPPPTEIHGDRYVLTGSTVDASWDGAALNNVVQYFGVSRSGSTIDQWLSVAPVNGQVIVNSASTGINRGINVYNGVNQDWGNTDPAACEVFCSSTTIDAATFNNLNSSPLTLVNGEAGKIIEFVGGFAIHDYGGTPFTMAGTFVIGCDSVVSSGINNAQATILTTGGNSIFTVSSDGSSAVEPISTITGLKHVPSDDLVAYVTTSNPSGGNGVIKLYYRYKVWEAL